MTARTLAADDREAGSSCVAPMRRAASGRWSRPAAGTGARPRCAPRSTRSQTIGTSSALPCCCRSTRGMSSLRCSNRASRRSAGEIRTMTIVGGVELGSDAPVPLLPRLDLRGRRKAASWPLCVSQPRCLSTRVAPRMVLVRVGQEGADRAAGHAACSSRLPEHQAASGGRWQGGGRMGPAAQLQDWPTNPSRSGGMRSAWVTNPTRPSPRPLTHSQTSLVSPPLAGDLEHAAGQRFGDQDVAVGQDLQLAAMVGVEGHLLAAGEAPDQLGGDGVLRVDLKDPALAEAALAGRPSGCRTP